MSEKITFKKLVEKISKFTRLSEQTTNSFIHELANIIESGIEKADKIPPVMWVHSLAAGKNLWATSDISHGDPYLRPVIYERNNDEIGDPNTILACKSLNLPKLSDSYNLTQKDKETVARGYLYVYDWMTDHKPDNAKYYLWAVGSYSQEQLQRVSARVNETDLAFAFQQ